MPKTVKGTSARKPLEASADHSDIEDWFGRLMPNLQRIVGDLDKSIRAAVPKLRFAVKYKPAFYGLPKHAG